MALATQAVFEFATLVADEPFYKVTCHFMLGGSVKASRGGRGGRRALVLADTRAQVAEHGETA
ncbi:hypothetical protein ABL850_33280 [Variovorax paradoxus]|jgi:hypothetical protein|uniref:hypothetical protein n=1 Tax=Variovorax paradoxus TaxID=34073 RepID=UPI0004192120